jgi:hypothetical protein
VRKFKDRFKPIAVDITNLPFWIQIYATRGMRSSDPVTRSHVM